MEEDDQVEPVDGPFLEGGQRGQDGEDKDQVEGKYWKNLKFGHKLNLFMRIYTLLSRAHSINDKNILKLDHMND